MRLEVFLLVLEVSRGLPSSVHDMVVHSAVFDPD
jgi:hypothetical protein